VFGFAWQDPQVTLAAPQVGVDEVVNTVVPVEFCTLLWQYTVLQLP
jgi:hypothetical protein